MATDQIEICGIKLANPLMNGAYIGSKTKADIQKLANSACGAIVVGSITVEARKANAEGGYWPHKDGIYSLNSFGMPNGGLAYFEKELPKIVKIAHAKNKPLIANVGGFDNDEFIQLVKLADKSGADIVELNLGCPNAWKDGQQKQIISYHPELIADLLQKIKKLKPTTKICLKISPLPPDLLEEVANVIIDSDCVQAVTATNSYPNTALNTGTGKHSQVLSGMSGRALKPISIGVVRQLRQLLPKEVDIIGCGGISSKNDVDDYLEAGASAVQLATALVDDGLVAFDNILKT